MKNLIAFVVVLALVGCISEQYRQVGDLTQQKAASLAQKYPDNKDALDVVAGSKAMTLFVGPPNIPAKPEDFDRLCAEVGVQAKTPVAPGWWKKLSKSIEDSTGMPWYLLLISIATALLGVGTVQGKLATSGLGSVVHILTYAIEKKGGDGVKEAVDTVLAGNPKARVILDNILDQKGYLAASGNGVVEPGVKSENNSPKA